MKHIFVFLLIAFSTNIVVAEPFNDCINKFAPAFTNLLSSSSINYNSSNLANDVGSLLQPTFNSILKTDPNCISAKNDLIAYKTATFSVETSQKIFDLELQFGNNSSMTNSLEFESVMPWYGILVVKKGSLDDYSKKDLPVIQTEYMRENRSVFYPDNSDKPLGIWGGCTHSNHTAADSDIINRAAHITANEEDSFWSGNDYYIYDGKDVYWGTAQLVGEVALTLLTFGTSAGVSAGKTSAQVAIAGERILNAAKAGSTAVKAVNLTTDAAKIERAIDLAAKAKAGKTAADVASRAEALTALSEAGITTTTKSASSINKIGKALETHASASAISAIKPGLIASTKTAWKSGFFKPWRLVKEGATTIRPKNVIAKTSLVGLKKQIATAAVATGEVGLGLALMKAYGYSTASVELAKNVKFSAFGLLSADDLEGRENEISHGAWITIDDVTEIYEGDKLNEAMAWAEAFKSDIDKVNVDGECDIDIYVVQVGISNPDKLGKREAYYWLYTDPVKSNLRVNGK